MSSNERPASRPTRSPNSCTNGTETTGRPRPATNSPAGTTVLVDEAGMVSTPAFARLVTLASEMQWRIALVGDPYQLQAVGRGGMFHELCSTGRTHELARIHRFTEPWEAAASLQLRRGDPNALDTYIAHDRVHAAPFDEHVATVTQRWLDATAAGEVAAVIASTNQHVDALNAAIQRARHLDPAVTAPIGGGETVMVGDQIVTRRNDRTITTNAGEPIRNRELWTVTAITDNGSLTVSPIRGHGTATLPADYARQHVRLGYAATEHGVQGDTVTAGIELATQATSRRGLYVALTRGQRDNTVLVVTDTHDIAEARDVLERILTNDRVDLPATAQRRELAATDCAPRRPEPTPALLHPRLAPRPQGDHPAQSSPQPSTQRSATTNSAPASRRDCCRPSNGSPSPSVGSTRTDRHSPPLTPTSRKRRTASGKPTTSRSDRKADTSAEPRTTPAPPPPTAPPQPTASARSRRSHRRHAKRSTRPPPKSTSSSSHYEAKTSSTGGTTRTRELDQLRELRAAVDDWQAWAAGKPISLEHVVTIAATLRTTDHFAGAQPLADVLDQWAAMNGVEIRPPQVSIPGPSIELGM